MAAKTSVKVLINGKAVTLAGYEDEEYLQKVANYINRKIAGFEGIRGYRTMPADLRNNLLAINIADDYFKAKLQAEALEDSFEKQEHDAYETKQDLVSAQIEIEELRKEIEELKRKAAAAGNDYRNNRNNGYNSRR